MARPERTVSPAILACSASSVAFWVAGFDVRCTRARTTAFDRERGTAFTCLVRFGRSGSDVDKPSWATCTLARGLLCLVRASMVGFDRALGRRRRPSIAGAFLALAADRLLGGARASLSRIQATFCTANGTFGFVALIAGVVEISG